MVRTEIFVAWSPYRGEFEGVVMRKLPGGKVGVAEPLSFKVEEAGYAVSPTFTLTQEEAQVLSDQLWNAGLRPAGSKQGHGAFEAQNRHLEDMRSLVFKIAPK